MSTLVAPPSSPRRLGAAAARIRLGADALPTVGLAAILCAVAFGADGGLRLGRTTATEVGLILGGGAAIAVSALAAPAARRAWGLGTTGLLAAFAVLSAVSITWSIQPADSWFEANRELAYLAVFAAAVALVHLRPGGWAPVIGAITLFAVVVSFYAVLTKVLPGALSADEIYARLREPYGYWNAVGLTAALGVPGCLWLGARRQGHAAVSALAYPALGLLLVCVLLSYSRGSLLAAVVGCAVWFALVPLRLRGVAVLATSAIGAVLTAAWTFAQAPLSEDRVPLELRETAGAQLGILLLAVLGLLLAAGLVIGFATARRAPGPDTRRQAGVVVLVCLALIPVGVALALALSDRGLGGSLSEGWRGLTDPDASTPSNDPGRLTATGSVRARYWDEALQIFSDNKAAGCGAGCYATARPRYREDTLDVRHAHGYVVQVLADLGLLGLAVSLALLAAWLAAADRAAGIFRRRRGAMPPERVGLLTLFAIVVVFGVHSFVDWTWFIPGTAVPALLAAGWLAGRGPLAETPAPATAPRALRTALRDRRRALAAAGAVLVAVTAAFTAGQPRRSVSAGQDALAALERRDVDAARELAGTARERNPLSVEPLFELSVIETAAGREVEARRALEDAVRLQPSNPSTWVRLAEFELFTLRRPQVAQTAIRPALFLDPRSDTAIGVFLQATRQAKAATEPPARRRGS